MLKQDIRFLKRRQQSKAKTYGSRIPEDELHDEDEITRNVHRMMMLIVRQQRVMVNHQNKIQDLTEQLHQSEKLQKRLARMKPKQDGLEFPLQAYPEEPQYEEEELGEHDAELQERRATAMSECGTENSSWMGIIFGAQTDESGQVGQLEEQPGDRRTRRSKRTGTQVALGMRRSVLNAEDHERMHKRAEKIHRETHRDLQSSTEKRRASVIVRNEHPDTVGLWDGVDKRPE